MKRHKRFFMWLYFSILFIPSLISADPLRVVVPLAKKLESLESEGGSLSIINFPGETFKIQPVFGDQRNVNVSFEGIPLNDPSAPGGQVNGKFLPDMSADVGCDDSINLNIQKSLEVAIHGASDQKWNIFSSSDFNPALMLEKITFNNQERLTKAFFSSKEKFKISDGLSLDYSFFYNMGQNQYMSYYGLNEEAVKQKGGKLSVLVLNKFKGKVGYSSFQRSYLGPFLVAGEHFFSEIKGFLAPKISLVFRLDAEANNQNSRLMGAINLEQNNFGLSLRFNNEGIYPKLYGMLEKHINFQQRVKFKILADYRPPHLTEIDTELFHRDQFLRVRSLISGEGLVGAKMRYESPLNVCNVFLDLKTEYFYKPIGWNYEKMFYENRQSFLRPSLALGFAFQESGTSWELRLQKYIQMETDSFQFVDIPKALVKVKFRHAYKNWNIKVLNVLSLDIDRYKEKGLTPLSGHAFDLSFEVSKKIEEFLIEPFFQFVLIRRDANAPVREGSLWWMGIRL